MSYDFDRITDRHGTGCYKFDFAKESGIPEENLSLWVADMDFPTADCVIDAVQKTVEQGIFGYTGVKDDYYEPVLSWYRNNFGWEAKKEWMVLTPGVVFAIANAVRAFTEPGDKIMIQEPVYYPFRSVIERNGREAVNNPLQRNGSRYEMDFSDMEEKLKDPALKMFILCSPHNPVGRVWDKEELIRLADLCMKYDVIIISDEIHSDFVWPGHTHHILPSLDARYEKNSVVCTAPSKSFNLAGLQLSNLFIPDASLRKKYKKALDEIGFGLPNQLGIAACRAAYTEGKTWLDELRAYIWQNILFARDYVTGNLPQVELIVPEGTYLLWLDFNGLGLSDEALNDLIINKAHLWLDAGSVFGEGGAGYQRINAACPREYLKKAMEQLKNAVDSL